MPNLILPPSWRIPEREVAPEKAWLDRRRFLKAAGIAGMGLAGLLGGCASGPDGEKKAGASGPDSRPVPPAPSGLYPAPRSKAWSDAGRSITPEEVAAHYNNFYEFSTDKQAVSRLVNDFQVRPWQVRVEGLCRKPRTWDVDDLEKLGLEERVYRFRCVEAWSMVVPWTGFPLKKLVEASDPDPRATHLRFLSFLRPDQAPGQKEQTWYNWPYYEGLRLDEAINELTLAVTGIYGHRLPKQHGAPVRIIAPWKYGYKSPKSIVRIVFTDKEPHTFWNDIAPDEYSFLSNVNPAVPHPRWSQATERRISTGQRIPTLPYNGYGEQVAALYA